jgi:hypothetical protein
MAPWLAVAFVAGTVPVLELGALVPTLPVAVVLEGRAGDERGRGSSARAASGTNRQKAVSAARFMSGLIALLHDCGVAVGLRGELDPFWGPLGLPVLLSVCCKLMKL